MKNHILLFIVSMTLMVSSFQPAFSQASYDDATIEAIIRKMTLEEKIAFIGGINRFYIRDYKQYGIPLIKMADGPVGVRNYGPSTAYPASVTLAASWDTAMAARVGNAIGKEARAKDVHIMLGPGMNMYRAPMNGRNFEYLGEDPYLAGQIASNYIKGMQKEGVMACAKHFMANYQEFDRHNVSSDMDERTMREIYLPAFKACVQEGNVATVMTSYNLVNGVHASQNDYLMNKILKDEWGFKGFVMSDWTSTYDGVACANAGLDLEMPEGVHMAKDTLISAIKAGKVSEKTIDEKIRRILKTYARFNLFDNPEISKGYTLDSVGVRQTSLNAARGGIVLLKNENNYLPMDKSKIKTIAVIGPNGDPAVTGGGGSSFVQPKYTTSLVGALQKLAGENIKVSYESGIYDRDLMPASFFDQPFFYTYDKGQQVPGLKAEFFSKRRPEGTPDYQTLYAKSNVVFSDSLPGVSKNTFSALFTGFVKVEKSGRYRFVVSSDEAYRFMIDGKQVIGSWRNAGETLHSGIVNLETGKEYKVTINYTQRTPRAVLRVGYETAEKYEEKVNERLQKAADLASRSDEIILSLGFNGETEHEGDDRTFKLPDIQERIIGEIIKTNKPFTIVMNAGGNVDMSNWINKTKALVYAWYPGQEGNQAVAENLFGLTNPSGKLPQSFEKKWEDNPTYNSYYDPDGDKHVKFTEGIFLGYRYYDTKHIETQFPFGFGLSYTTFEYSDLQVNKNQFSTSDPVEVKLTVRNTGKYDGAEVVQLYVGEQSPLLPRPAKELKAFAKVWLKAGESKEVSFTLNKDAFQYYNPDKQSWVEDPAKFDLMAGSSSKDIRLIKRIEMR